MRIPILAKSDNRSIPAKKHPYAGGPEDWINSAISFDFFINWSNYSVESEIWVKRILDEGEIPPEIGIEEYLEKYNQDFLDTFNFAKSNNGDLHYILFDDTQNWSDDNSILFDLHFVAGSWRRDIVNLRNIKSRIFNLSGGETKIGSKGLIYSTSNLEAALSYTTYLWPGDVDAFVLDNNKDPLVILEYKKHTRDTSYESVCTYYNNGKDRKKYNRLHLLRNAINPSLPLIVVTYPTQPNFNEVLLECISIDLRKNIMYVVKSVYCKLPTPKDGCNNYIEAIKYLITYWKELQ